MRGRACVSVRQSPPTRPLPNTFLPHQTSPPNIALALDPFDLGSMPPPPLPAPTATPETGNTTDPLGSVPTPPANGAGAACTAAALVILAAAML